MATISGGVATERERVLFVQLGKSMGRSGFAKRASTCADCCDVGVLLLRALLKGRWERRSAEVGMDSGMFSDMMLLRLILSAWSMNLSSCYEEAGRALVGCDSLVRFTTHGPARRRPLASRLYCALRVVEEVQQASLVQQDVCTLCDKIDSR